jgi:hypothetical protein
MASALKMRRAMRATSPAARQASTAAHPSALATFSRSFLR